jgi:hypothetical protein
VTYTNPTTDQKMEISAIFREMIRHEDNLISSRLGWMGLINSALLFGALTDSTPPVVSLAFCLAGFTSSIVVWRGVVAAQIAIHRIVADWFEIDPNGELPRIMGYAKGKPEASKLITPAYLIPWVFVFVWAVVGATQIFETFGKPWDEWLISFSTIQSNKCSVASLVVREITHITAMS